jgi:hypothetical protein
MFLNLLGNFFRNNDLVNIRNPDVLVQGDELDRVAGALRGQRI